MIDCSKLRPGIAVKVVKLETTDGMIAPPEVIAARDEGELGVTLRALPGHGGDVWLVKHDNGTTGAYCYTELSEIGTEAYKLLLAFKRYAAVNRRDTTSSTVSDADKVVASRVAATRETAAKLLAQSPIILKESVR